MPTMGAAAILSLCVALFSLGKAQNPTQYIPKNPPFNVITLTITPSPTATSFSLNTIHFSPTNGPHLSISNGAVETSVIEALASVMSTWTNGPLYQPLQSAIFTAAPSADQASLAVNGYNWDDIVRATWFTAVATPYQQAVSSQEVALQSVYDRITGNGKTGNDAESLGVRFSGAKRNLKILGMMLVMGVVWVVGWL